MHDWSNAATRVVAVAAVHCCARLAAHQSSHQFQSTCDWKHFATLVAAMMQLMNHHISRYESII